MNQAELKTRSPVGDFFLCFITGGLWALKPIQMMKKNISLIEEEVKVRKRKPRLKGFDVLIIIFAVSFVIGSVGMMGALIAAFIERTTQSLPISSAGLVIGVVYSLYLCVFSISWGYIFISSRRLRHRMSLVLETEGFVGFGPIVFGFNYVFLILFAFVIFFGAYISLYRTTSIYNDLVDAYNDALL